MKEKGGARGSSDMVDAKQGPGQGCVLAPLLFNAFFTAVLRLADKRFTANAVIMDTTVQFQRMKEKGGRGLSLIHI